MKYLISILSLFVVVGCSNNSGSDKQRAGVLIKKKGVPAVAKPEIPLNINYDSLDVSVKNEIRVLDSVYGRTPYYTVVGNKKMFIVLKGKFNADSAYYIKKFNGRFKYGIFGEDLKAVLACEYDKIYNPNLTMVNCMEIKREDKVGLFNFVTKEILEPQFEYIVPSNEMPDNIGYGFKNGNWYKIENMNKFKMLETHFSPVDLFRTLSFNVHEVDGNLMYSVYNYLPDRDKYEASGGIGVVVTPSYIEHLNIMPEICDDIILSKEKSNYFGTTEMNFKTDTVKSITDKIISFIVSFYNSGVGGRGYENSAKQVIVYNKEKKSFDSKQINIDYGYRGYGDNLCHTSGYKFVNDTIIQVLVENQTDTSKKARYDLENTYLYKLITRDGGIKDLKSNRYYSFTKYIEINENYFKGCFIKFIKSDYISPDNKIIVHDALIASDSVDAAEHLTIEDLDVMVNEIYADYGLKFKTEKWQKYFSQFKWYKPEYDNVDNKLTKIDKKNIETIAREKQKMKGKENEYVKKHKQYCPQAG